MKFSVIIPVYNSEKFLAKCVDSICDNTFPKDAYEVILIDDGSTDDSLKIANELKEKYGNIVVLFQENSGPAKARNEGIAKARGEYFLFVDSDDEVMPGYFDVLDKTCDGESDIVVFGSRHSSGEAFEDKCFLNEEIESGGNYADFYLNYLGKSDINSSCNNAFKRRLFIDCDVRFPEGTVVEEDLIFVLRALKNARKIRLIEDVLYIYVRRDEGSVTTKYNPIKFDCKKRAYSEEKEVAIEWGSKDLESFFDDSLISYVSSCINNLMYSSCPLTKKEKIAEIKRFFSDDIITKVAGTFVPRSKRTKMMRVLILKKMARLAYYIHKAIFKLRGRK